MNLNIIYSFILDQSIITFDYFLTTQIKILDIYSFSYYQQQRTFNLCFQIRQNLWRISTSYGFTIVQCFLCHIFLSFFLSHAFCLMLFMSYFLRHTFCAIFFVSCFLCHAFYVLLFMSCFLCHAFCVMFFVSCFLCHAFYVMLFVSCFLCHAFYVMLLCHAFCVMIFERYMRLGSMIRKCVDRISIVFDI